MFILLIFLAFFINTWDYVAGIDKNDDTNKYRPLTAKEANISMEEMTTKYKFLEHYNQYIIDHSSNHEPSILNAPPPSIGEPWPLVQNKNNTNLIHKLSQNVKFEFNYGSPCDIIEKGIERYKKRIFKDQKILHATKEMITILFDDLILSKTEINKIKIRVYKCTNKEYPHLNMIERYSINISNDQIEINAAESWGILRGLETLTQMLFKNFNSKQTIFIKGVVLEDFPLYSHRGLMIDTARHYISIENILINIDAMEMNKMNVFHWHITDDNSFPFVSESHPELSEKGAFDKNCVYNSTVIRYIVEYARQRGIRVIPELDMPGHTYSWGKSHAELLLQCKEKDSQMTRGSLNPILLDTFELIFDLLKDLTKLFHDDFIHIGFDEIGIGCVSSDPAVAMFIERYDITKPYVVFRFFLNQMAKLIHDKYPRKKVIVWQDVYDEFYDKFPKNIYVQLWKSEPLDYKDRLVNNNNQFLIYSKDFYLDVPIYGNKWLSFYKSKINVGGLTPSFIGGEAALWTEYISDLNIQQVAWPTTSSVAEILWNQRSDDMLMLGKRFEENRCRMMKYGIKVGVGAGPSFCDYDINHTTTEKIIILDIDKKTEVKTNNKTLRNCQVITRQELNKACHFIFVFALGCMIGFALHLYFFIKPIRFIVVLCILQIVTFCSMYYN